MLHRLIPSLLCAGLLAACASRKFDHGTPAPDLALDELVQAPAGANADWNSLRGNVVVLEYWSSW